MKGIWSANQLTGAMAGSATAAGRKNMMLLVQLRWIAALGQIATIMGVTVVLGVQLPLDLMLAPSAALVAINGISILLLRERARIGNTALLLALLFDIAALTWQLYLSGGVTNPFISLFLLQVVLGAVLLEAWSGWLLAGVTSLCFGGLSVFYRPLDLPRQHEGSLFFLYQQGSLIAFALIAVLLVLFVTKISGNLRALDARFAAARQRAAEEELIVRLGLLASGAAHELGTPLSSLAVILSDWRRMPALAGNAELLAEITDMQAEVQRCKSIVTGILLHAGEARGEAPGLTTVHTFLNELVGEWRETRPIAQLDYINDFGTDLAIVSDTALKKVICNLLDNAFEAAPQPFTLTARRQQQTLVLTVTDHGPGFAPELLSQFGKPYQSSKGRAGGGLGLFLVVNMARQLGGAVKARNLPAGGACVTLHLPLAALGARSLIGGQNGE